MIADGPFVWMATLKPPPGLPINAEKFGELIERNIVLRYVRAARALGIEGGCRIVDDRYGFDMRWWPPPR
jgi:hypothetical protein